MGLRLWRGDAYRIALRQGERVTRERLREICDEFTGKTLDPWELDKLTEWTEGHPAYQALPEESEPTPTAYGR